MMTRTYVESVANFMQISLKEPVRETENSFLVNLKIIVLYLPLNMIILSRFILL